MQQTIAIAQTKRKLDKINGPSYSKFPVLITDDLGFEIWDISNFR